MKISELTGQILADYLRIDEAGEIELREINMMLSGAIEYAKSYTGLTVEEMDAFEDITVAIMILVSDYYENRTLYLDYKFKEENKAVQAILTMHCNNFL